MYQGVQLTRQFRALKLWMSFKVFGLDAISRAIDAGFDNAELAEALLRQAGCWEIVTPAQMAIVTFRYQPSGGDEELANRVTHDLVGRLLEDGFAFASGTQLGGRAGHAHVLQQSAHNAGGLAGNCEPNGRVGGAIGTEIY